MFKNQSEINSKVKFDNINQYFYIFDKNLADYVLNRYIKVKWNSDLIIY